MSPTDYHPDDEPEMDWRGIAWDGQRLIEEMDRKMLEGATEDEDGFINSYRIPVGPWHRLLTWSRSFTTGLNLRDDRSANPNGGTGE